MKSFNNRRLMCSAAGLALLLAGNVAQAQTAPAQVPAEDQEATGLADIIVTAQRKSERLQEVPIAVNVIQSEALTSRGVTTTTDLPALVPALSFAMTGGAGTPYLRGVGSNAGNPNDEPSVATYIDGVYIASPYANATSLANIDQIEVLKGPQGTLFGRNATGGVIQVITRDPQRTPALEASIGYGNFQTVSGSLYATTGLSENLAIDIALQGSDQGEGWGYNFVRNEETYLTTSYGARSKLVFTPNDTLRAVLSADYSYLKSNTSDYRLPQGELGIDGQLSPAGEYDTASIITLNGIGTPGIESKQGGVSANIGLETGLGRIVSITAFRKNTGYYHAEADGTPVPFVEADLPISQENFSQEFQLLSPEDSPFDWTIGGYYYKSDAGYPNLTFAGLAFGTPPGANYSTLLLDVIQNTVSKSVYAQATVEVMSGTRVTGGIRYTDEDQESRTRIFGASIPNVQRGFEELTWRGAIDHAFSEDIHVYASVNRGVKGGGFDLLTPFSTGYSPEFLDAYEIGLKSKIFANTLRFNASYFYYDYQNIQVQVIPAGGAGIVSTTNAGAATVQGLDVDFEYAPTRQFSLSGGFAIIDGVYDEFANTVAYPASPLSGAPMTIDASGNDTIRTPKFTANLTAAYDVETESGTFPLSLTVSHNSGFFFSADNRLEQPAYTLINGSIGWEPVGRAYSVTVWGSNLTDEYYLAQGVPSGLGDLTSPSAPRTYGITLRTKFGG